MAKLFKVVEEHLEIVPFKITSFNSNDVFILDNREAKTIWIWIGKKTSTRQKFNAARLAEKLDKEEGGIPTITTINEGEEPQELLGMF